LNLQVRNSSAQEGVELRLSARSGRATRGNERGEGRLGRDAKQGSLSSPMPSASSSLRAPSEILPEAGRCEAGPLTPWGVVQVGRLPERPPMAESDQAKSHGAVGSARGHDEAICLFEKIRAQYDVAKVLKVRERPEWHVREGKRRSQGPAQRTGLRLGLRHYQD
jgi:hypothetical protein